MPSAAHWTEKTRAAGRTGSRSGAISNREGMTHVEGRMRLRVMVGALGLLLLVVPIGMVFGVSIVLVLNQAGEESTEIRKIDIGMAIVKWVEFAIKGENR